MFDAEVIFPRWTKNTLHRVKRSKMQSSLRGSLSRSDITFLRDGKGEKGLSIRPFDFHTSKRGVCRGRIVSLKSSRAGIFSGSAAQNWENRVIARRLARAHAFDNSRLMKTISTLFEVLAVRRPNFVENIDNGQMYRAIMPLIGRGMQEALNSRSEIKAIRHGSTHDPIYPPWKMPKADRIEGRTICAISIVIK